MYWLDVTINLLGCPDHCLPYKPLENKFCRNKHITWIEIGKSVIFASVSNS